MRDRAEEQLSEAYTRAVAVTPGVLIIRPNVQGMQTFATTASCAH